MNQNLRNDCGILCPTHPDMELPFLHVVLYEPDVALTDLVLSIETCFFGIFFTRTSSKDSLRTAAAALFFFLSTSSLLGAIYHGFFPLRTGTYAGWLLWIATMLSIGAAASSVWILTAILKNIPLRRILIASLLLFGGYIYFLLVIDSRFWVSIVFSVPPLIALLLACIRKCLQDKSVPAIFGVAAIVLMFIASALQQMHVGIHPIYFNHNALYHLIQGVALALLFQALRLFQSED